MAFTFKKWLFNRFPYRYKEQDTNKDVNGEGTFERYLKNFEDEIDEEIYPFIRDFMNIFDVMTVDKKYLPYISYYLGEPPSANGDIDIYRKILAYAVRIYKIKGTKESYRLLFSLYGLDVDIVEAIPRREATYDMAEVKYDDGWTYDLTCENCTCYYIVYRPLTEENNTQEIDLTVPLEIITLINKIVCFIQPINAILCGVYRKITYADELVLDMVDNSDLLLDRVTFVNLNAPLPGTPDDTDIIAAYESENWESDLDQIREDLIVDGPINAMRFYAARPDGSVVLSNWIYGVPTDSTLALSRFVNRWFQLNLPDDSLENAGDYLYPSSPEGTLYVESAVSVDPMITVNKTLVDFNSLNPLPGCPDPTYPIGLYGVDDTSIGIVYSPEEAAELWNSYAPNKEYGYLTHVNGCTFALHRRADETNIMAQDIKATVLTVGENGDFNEDFTIQPGGDFY
jgi:phage tail-like protein